MSNLPIKNDIRIGPSTYTHIPELHFFFFFYIEKKTFQIIFLRIKKMLVNHKIHPKFVLAMTGTDTLYLYPTTSLALHSTFLDFLDTLHNTCKILDAPKAGCFDQMLPHQRLFRLSDKNSTLFKYWLCSPCVVTTPRQYRD